MCCGVVIVASAANEEERAVEEGEEVSGAGSLCSVAEGECRQKGISNCQLQYSSQCYSLDFTLTSASAIQVLLYLSHLSVSNCFSLNCASRIFQQPSNTPSQATLRNL